MTPALRPLDRAPEVGERVWWEPPEHIAGAGWYQVILAGDYEEAVWLKNGEMPAREGFCHELYREVEA